ncbi:recombinase family protein [Sphingomonas sp. SUN019]|nr:recombinase family protein [Sphingomonas sp. SUN019]
MSTEHQQYSTDNQAAAIQLYADHRGFEIVRTYSDDGKSGLNIGGRAGLQTLLADVEGGKADFTDLIVYDVSRFGRFQDPDEAASYELRCRQAGVAVHYCAEQFENDGSIGSSIIKTVKRAMAGEYSRELSVKVFAGQANLIRLGYRQGGMAGYGLRRLLVDQDGNPKAELSRGEHKSIATDRVVLSLGPPEEVAVVREVYSLFTTYGRTETEIANILNERGVLSDLDRGWTRGTVHQLLINEKYIGNNVWAKTSFKLKQNYASNDPSEWVRAEGVFPSIVDTEAFIAAQKIIAKRSERLTDAEMLDSLRSILVEKGVLTGLIVDEAATAPSSSTFRARFGSLLRAYTLVGFVPRNDYRYLEVNRALRQMHPSVVEEAILGLCAAGGDIKRDPSSDILTINSEFTASIIVVRCFATAGGSLRWKLRFDTALKPDLTVAIRMDEANEVAKDYYILPRLDMRDATLRLAEHNGLSFDAYRFDTLDPFYRLASREPLRRVA